MSDIARSKLDIIYQDMFRDINELLTRLEQTEAQIKQSSGILGSTYGKLQDYQDRIIKEVHALHQEATRSLQQLSEEKAAELIRRIKISTEQAAKDQIALLTTTIETLGAKAAHKAISKAVSENLDSSMRRIQDLTLQLQSIGNNAEGEIRAAAKSVHFTFAKRLVLNGITVLATAFLGLFFYHRIERVFPSLSSDDQRSIYIGRDLEVVWSSLDKQTQNKIQAAFDRLAEERANYLLLQTNPLSGETYEPPKQ